MDWNERGGAAFPIPHSAEPGAYEAETGMSLRDWFAGQVLAGILANPENVRAACNRAMTAEDAYQTADAMLTARSRK